MKKEIKLVKLSSGEEFVAEITIDSQEYLFCKNMAKFMPIQNPNTGKMQLMMVPFNPLIPDDDIVRFNQQHITFCISPVEEFIEQYNNAFSELTLPPTKQLIL
jgi:hypothetical protein